MLLESLSDIVSGHRPFIDRIRTVNPLYLLTTIYAYQVGHSSAVHRDLGIQTSNCSTRALGNVELETIPRNYIRGEYRCLCRL